ncbi:uncharacterized protein COLE_03586 [Cutaneotrichosporon oleaginosum]|uniref:uncharacterized protein n=1 Tax=Cutaneotrichosporon oleaginosum TaxID=879819 RepID=UPI001328176A|nr:hypothetical protein COLE_03586 [Cutaneotrichosporon oleaginosum]
MTVFPSNLTELYAPPGETRANVTIQIPPATAFILIRGTVGPGRSFPTYQWTPAPPNGSLSSVKGGSADSPWVSEQILYAQRLDPDLDYMLDIAQSRLGAVALSSVTFYSANITEPTQPPVSDPGRSKTPVGVIVGAILAVAGLTILVSVGFHFLVRRPRKRREREEAAALAGLNAGFVPFGTSDYNTQPPPMQETDAGALDPPPQYQPEWSTDGRSATTGSTSALTPLAPWKEPYINGTYTQQEAPLSASSTANATLQGASLPRGAAPAQTPVSK